MPAWKNNVQIMGSFYILLAVCLRSAVCLDLTTCSALLRILNLLIRRSSMKTIDFLGQTLKETLIETANYSGLINIIIVTIKSKVLEIIFPKL